MFTEPANINETKATRVKLKEQATDEFRKHTDGMNTVSNREGGDLLFLCSMQRREDTHDDKDTTRQGVGH